MMKNLCFFTLAFVLMFSFNACVTDHTPADILTQKGLPLSPIQEFPARTSPAYGNMDIYYNKVTHDLSFTVNWFNLTDVPTGAHIHGTAPRGANAGIKFDFFNMVPKTTSGTFSSSVKVDGISINEADLLNGLYYMNFHTPQNPGGEIRGQIEFYDQSTVVSKMGLQLKGTNEVPANASTATGTADVSYNKTTKRLSYFLTWTGLAGVPTGSHIHGAAVKGVNAPVLFDFFSLIPKTTSGAYSGSVIVDEVKLKEADLLAGLYYFNIHNSTFPGGEIRAQIEF